MVKYKCECQTCKDRIEREFFDIVLSEVQGTWSNLVEYAIQNPPPRTQAQDDGA